MSKLHTKFRVLIVICGGIAAFKSLVLIRLLRKKNISVRCVMTSAAAHFVTPLSVASLSGDKVYSSLFSLTDESEMGHIELSRQADLIVVVPATANMIAKMANGIADDLASTILMATDKPVLIVPSMNVRMWEHPATQRNIRRLSGDGIQILGPVQGDMACGEYGYGRMLEPEPIAAMIASRAKRDNTVILLIGSIAQQKEGHMSDQKWDGSRFDAIWEALFDHGVAFEIWGGLDIELPLVYTYIEDDRALEQKQAETQKTIFSIASFVESIPKGLHDLRAIEDPAAEIIQVLGLS